MVSTNDLKKGTRIKLKNGYEAKIEDNRKGNTRLCTVYGAFTEMGSVYSHDIVGYQDSEGNWNYNLEYTASQKKCKAMNETLFG